MVVERRNAAGLADPPGYSHVAIARGATLVFTAGAVPLDAAGDLVGPDDAVAQTDQQAMVWEAVQRSPIAATPSTLVGVPLLGYRGQLVEIEAVAVLDD